MAKVVNLSSSEINYDTLENQVAHLEIQIPDGKNNQEYVNDVLITAIRKVGFLPIGNEVKWCKNDKQQNVLRVFGATEGRCTLRDVYNTINSL